MARREGHPVPSAGQAAFRAEADLQLVGFHSDAEAGYHRRTTTETDGP
jgi:hypothetical protein